MRNRIATTAVAREDIRRLAHAQNFQEVIQAVPLGIAPETTIDTAGCDCGGLAIDRSVFRKFLPDARWFVYAAGRVDPVDSDGVTIALEYVKDDNTTVALGTSTLTGGGMVKASLGPFDVFGTASVPGGEDVAIVRLFATKENTGFAELRNWCVWVRFLPSLQ